MRGPDSAAGPGKRRPNKKRRASNPAQKGSNRLDQHEGTSQLTPQPAIPPLNIAQISSTVAAENQSVCDWCGLAYAAADKRQRYCPDCRSQTGYNRRQRERHQQHIPRVSPEELELFRQDSRREEHCGIKKYVVCRECGVMLRSLVRHKELHENYLEKCKDAQGNEPPLVCADESKKLSDRAFRQFAPQRGRLRPNRKVRGYAAPASPWDIVCGRQQGKSYAAIALDLGRDEQTIADDGRALGLSGKHQQPILRNERDRWPPAWHDFGEPVTGGNACAIESSHRTFAV